MSSSAAVSPQHLKSLIENFINLSWNSGRFNLLQQLATPDYVYRSSFIEGFKDFQGFVDYVKEIRAAIPDLDVSIEELMVEGDKAISVSTFSGSFEQPFFGITPSHRVISFVGISVWEIRRGRVCDQNTLVDVAALRRQLESGVNDSKAAI